MKLAFRHTGALPRTRARPAPRRGSRRGQAGAALLLAMLIVTLVATLASGMVWQQWRAIEVEAAERARVQAFWLLSGSLDWARLILREAKPTPTLLGDTWSTPLAETPLSSFLAADQNNNAGTDTGPQAYLSGDITDAQSRYNLYNLLQDDPDDAAAELRILQRLCDTLGVPEETASQIAKGMNGASSAEEDSDPSNPAPPTVPLPPQRVSQLTWLGVPADQVQALTPYVEILPQGTPVNINTAPAEVLMAAIDGLDRSSADRLVQARKRAGFANLDAAKPFLPTGITLTGNKHVGVNSTYFEVRGQLRYEDNIISQQSLVQRRGADVVVLNSRRIPHE
jgi:general secretion pathway protein K